MPGGARALAPSGGLATPPAGNGLPAPGARPAPRPDAEPPRPTPQGRSRALVRVRQGLLLFGVPVTAIVVLELVAAAVLLAPAVPILEEGLVLGAVLVLAVGMLVPLRGMRLGTWVITALGYAGRRHVFTAIRSEPRADSGPDPIDGQDTIVVPAEVSAFFPGLNVVRASSRAGQEIGLVQWQGRWMAVAELTGARSDVLMTGPSLTVPVERLLASLAGRNFGLDAVQVITQSMFGNVNRFGEGTMARISAELAEFAPPVRSRSMWISVRIDPVRASAAIAARGGGREGLGRLATAALNRIESESRGLNLVAVPLEAEAVLQAMSGALLQPASTVDAPMRWTESWKSIASMQTYHRCYAVSAWHRQTLDGLAVSSGFGVTVSHEVRNLDSSGGPQVVSIVRLSASAESELDRGSRQLRAGCRSLGVGLRLMRGQQASAFRMTVPGGQR